MGHSVSKIFEDIGNVFTEPVRDTYNFVTGNPKGNGIGDIWNNAVGPGNDTQQLLSDNPLGQAVKKAGLGDWAAPAQLPTWDDLGTPGKAFAQQVDQQNKVLPDSFQPYAQPVEAAALSLFNPFAGAAFQTAYGGGKQQELNKGFDWGEFGKDAAINFGTAAVSSGANKLLSNANAASAAKTAAASPTSATSAFNASNNLDSLVGNTASNFAPNVTSSALTANSANALSGVGAIPSAVSALDSFSAPFNSSSQSLIPKAQSLQSSGIGDAAYKTGINTGKTLVNNSITDTLAPKGTQPISGALDGFGDTGGSGSAYQSQWGDILNAFGGNEINTANPNGQRIDSTAFNSAVDRLGANSYLQKTQARDTSLPAGQYQPDQNTPYANRLSEIDKGSTQSYTDLVDQVNNANRYYSIIDSNPGLKAEDLDAYLADPSQGVLGNFRVAPEQADYFKGLRTLGPSNMSLIK